MPDSRIPYDLSDQHPSLRPLDGKPLMVHVVVNVEVWDFNEPMPRQLLSSPHGKQALPDVPNFSWVDYGMRAGLPRILRSLEQRQLPASASFNAGVVDAYPQAAAAIRDAGWEFIGHGYRQRSLHAEPDESEAIRATLDRIQEFTGSRPRGWLGPGTQETYETPDKLTAAGIEYTLDWSVDDRPLWMTTQHGPLLAIPYTLEINDSVLWAMHHYSSSEMYDRVVSTLETFQTELQSEPRILTLGLHPHLIGVPHRFGYLERILDLLLGRDDSIFLTGSQVLEWFREQEPAVR